MKLVSINVGLPRAVEWHGERVRTGIFKEPVAGRVAVGRLNLAGDRQADPEVHGGDSKAIYAYANEHYAYWREQLPGVALTWGMFGENFTTDGLLEDEVAIGDRFRIGTAEVEVTQPRLPCFKLGVKFGRDDMSKLFLASGRTGFYLRVVREGEAGAGDAIEPLHGEVNRITVAEITHLYLRRDNGRAKLEQAAQLAALPEGWKRHFRNQLEGHRK